MRNGLIDEEKSSRLHLVKSNILWNAPYHLFQRLPTLQLTFVSGSYTMQIQETGLFSKLNEVYNSNHPRTSQCGNSNQADSPRAYQMLSHLEYQ